MDLTCVQWLTSWYRRTVGSRPANDLKTDKYDNPMSGHLTTLRGFAANTDADYQELDLRLGVGWTQHWH